MSATATTGRGTTNTATTDDDVVRRLWGDEKARNESHKKWSFPCDEEDIPENGAMHCAFEWTPHPSLLLMTAVSEGQNPMVGLYLEFLSMVEPSC